MLRQKNLLRWKSLLTDRLPKGKRRKRSRGGMFSRRLAAEPLEDRRMLAVLTVNTDLDSTTPDEVLTLREAVLLVNDGGDSIAALGRALTAGELAQIDTTEPFGTNDTIEFNIPGAGPHTILVGNIPDGNNGALPNITEPVVIDGYTQPGASPNTSSISSSINASLQIVLDGSATGAAANGLTITAGDSTVTGLVIHSFGDDGIEVITNSGNTIRGNFIGTDVTGEVDLGNGDDGIYIVSVGSNTIGGTTNAARNLISGNDGDGIELQGSNANTNSVLGNFIGTDKDGDTSLENSNNGVRVANAPGNTIGGSTVASRNLISGNNLSGVLLESGNATTNLVYGNYIGTDRVGNAAVGNGAAGVMIDEGSSNSVGGTTAGLGNLISGNSTGVLVTNTSATINIIAGNTIGTNAAGTADLGNTGHGVFIDGANRTTVGGTTLAARNLISSNDGHGVYILGEDADFNEVRGNFRHFFLGKLRRWCAH